MPGRQVSVPGVDRISTLVDALCNYAARSAREHWTESLTKVCVSPRLASWDALAWFELAGDWDPAAFLTSGSVETERLVRSLQSLLQWQGQSELHEMLLCMRISTTGK